MRVIDSCAKCLLDKQIARANESKEAEKKDVFIDRVKAVIDNRKESDCAPYLVSVFNEIYEECFGKVQSYGDIKREYNDLVLSMEADIEKKIYEDCKDMKDSLIKSLLYARIGNYIDFGAMNHVDKSIFLALFDNVTPSENDLKTFEDFYSECSKAGQFLLITDNCGEIVLDKLFVRALKKCFPLIKVKVLVRGKEVLNDATMEDALYVGMDKEATLVRNGNGVAGTVYEMMTEEAKNVYDDSDVILAKGQGNYESMSGQGRHVYYSFLCKCDLFITRFHVPPLTGMFVAE